MILTAASTTQAIELDLSGLTSVLAIVLGIGVVVLLVWMWRIGHQLEHGVAPSEKAASSHESSADLASR